MGKQRKEIIKDHKDPRKIMLKNLKERRRKRLSIILTRVLQTMQHIF